MSDFYSRFLEIYQNGSFIDNLEEITLLLKDEVEKEIGKPIETLTNQELDRIFTKKIFEVSMKMSKDIEEWDEEIFEKHNDELSKALEEFDSFEHLDFGDYEEDILEEFLEMEKEGYVVDDELMTFDSALLALKDGFRIQRIDWDKYWFLDDSMVDDLEGHIANDKRTKDYYIYDMIIERDENGILSSATIRHQDILADDWIIL